MLVRAVKIFKQILTTPYFWLGLILIFAFQVRTYRLDRPLADWHSWRQADTAAVARNFVKNGFTILTPRFDDLTPISEDDLPNPEGYRYVEFPLYSVFVGATWLVFPYQEWAARTVSIFLSLGSIVLLFLITRRYLGEVVALVSTFIFAFLPYNIFYSTVILPEPLLIFLILGTLLFFDLWVEKKHSIVADTILAILAIAFSAFAILTKPSTAFLALPLLYLAYHHQGLTFYKSAKVWLFVIFTFIAFWAWRLVAYQHPEGIPRFWWLLNGNNIRFKGAFFYWIVQDRLGRLMLGGAGLSLFVLGLLHRAKKEGLFFLSWLLGMILYVIVFATGNVTHDYYQAPLSPILSIYVGKGVVYLFTQKGAFFQRLFYALLAVSLVMLMFGLTWREVRTLFNINNPKIVEAGKAVDEILPQNAKVIAPYNGDTAFLYQTNRQGWAVVYRPIVEMIELGATHYVSVNFDSQTQDLLKQYTVLKQTNDFVIIDLQKPAK